MIIEIGIYTCFVIFIFFYINSATRALSVLGFAAASVSLEIMNVTTFHSQGTVYPESIFYFPGYSFPVAIILLSVIYGGVIGLISLKIVNLLNMKTLRRSIFVLIAATLNLSSIFIEKAGVMSGYWIHKKAHNISDIWHFVYLFYFCVILGGIIFLFDESRKGSD